MHWTPARIQWWCDAELRMVFVFLLDKLWCWCVPATREMVHTHNQSVSAMCVVGNDENMKSTTKRANILYSVLFTNSDVYSFAATATVRHTVEYIRDANLSSTRQTFLCCVSLCTAFSHTHHHLLLLLILRRYFRRRISVRCIICTSASSHNTLINAYMVRRHCCCCAGEREKRRNETNYDRWANEVVLIRRGVTREDQCACCCAATFI